MDRIIVLAELLGLQKYRENTICLPEDFYICYDDGSWVMQFLCYDPVLKRKVDNGLVTWEIIMGSINFVPGYYVIQLVHQEYPSFGWPTDHGVKIYRAQGISSLHDYIGKLIKGNSIVTIRDRIIDDVKKFV